MFPLNESAEINFGKARWRDFYKLLVSKTHTHDHPSSRASFIPFCFNFYYMEKHMYRKKRFCLQGDPWSNWPQVSENLSINKDSWTSIFKSLKNKETRLKEFQFKLTHRIVITRKEFSYSALKVMTNACILGIRTLWLVCSVTSSKIKIVTVQ